VQRVAEAVGRLLRRRHLLVAEHDLLPGGDADVPAVHDQVEAVEEGKGVGEGRRAEVAVVLGADHRVGGEERTEAADVSRPDVRGVTCWTLTDVQTSTDQRITLRVDDVVEDVEGRPAVARTGGVPVMDGVDDGAEAVGTGKEVGDLWVHDPSLVPIDRQVLKESDT
jgi:hypothetical protein